MNIQKLGDIFIKFQDELKDSIKLIGFIIAIVMFLFGLSLLIVWLIEWLKETNYHRKGKQIMTGYPESGKTSLMKKIEKKNKKNTMKSF